VSTLRKFIALFFKPIHLQPIERVSGIVRSLSITGKIIFGLAGLVMAFSALFLVWKVNQNYLIEVPSEGGSLTEGVIGSPRFINPILAISDADRDLTALVYSGLLRITPEGEYISDLAKNWSVSDDSLTYSFILKDAYFHDGKKVTTEDVAYTILTAQDPGLKSPRRGSFEGVRVEIINEKEIHFILSQRYAPFIENLTIGILPKHIWKDASVDQFQFSPFNTNPIGSGPFKVVSIKNNSAGLPIYYEFEPFSDHALGRPYINKLILKFYQNEESLLGAFVRGQIESINSITPTEIPTNARTYETTLPRVFGLFLNQNQAPVFLNKEVRKALNISVDREKIVESIFGGHANSLVGPLPPTGIISKNPSSQSADRDAALTLLLENGWKRNEESGILEKKTKTGTDRLVFSIATADIPELVATANQLKKSWEQIGMSVEIKIFDTNDLNQNVIRPRQYDAVLFGEIIGRGLDLYPFWHSSQRNDPGLNIAMYTSIAVDKILEDARITSNKETRAKLYENLQTEIQNDLPAIFVYSPNFIYVAPDKVKDLKLGYVIFPAERFSNIYQWYVETDKVWKFFGNTR